MTGVQTCALPISICTYNYVEMEIDFRGQAYLTRKNLELLMGKKRRTLDDKIRSLVLSRQLVPLKRGFYIDRKSVV